MSMTNWFHVLRALAEDGNLAKMSGSSSKVYLAIKSQVGLSSGESIPTYRRLMELTGLEREAIRNGLVELEKLGLLESSSIPGKRGKRYKVIEKITINDNESIDFSYQPLDFKKACNEIKQYITGEQRENFQFIMIRQGDNIQINQHLHIHLDREPDPEIMKMIEDGVPWTEILKRRFRLN